MASREIPGIKGFFDDLGNKPSPPNTKPVSIESLAKPTVEKIERPHKEPVGDKIKARVGRPPGLRNGDRSEKAKATMHISESLLNFYRDWSWEARCNLGELIERAMASYKQAREQIKEPLTSTKHSDRASKEKST
jgi:hypothetical protein